MQRASSRIFESYTKIAKEKGLISEKKKKKPIFQNMTLLILKCFME
jgi:hypothetical protein